MTMYEIFESVPSPTREQSAMMSPLNSWIRPRRNILSQARILNDLRYIFVIIAEVDESLLLCSRHNETVYAQNLAYLEALRSAFIGADQQESLPPVQMVLPVPHPFIPLIAHPEMQDCGFHEMEDCITGQLTESTVRPWYAYGRRAEVGHVVSRRAYMISRTRRVFRMTGGRTIFVDPECVPLSLSPDMIFTVPLRSDSSQPGNEPTVRYLILKLLVTNGPGPAHSVRADTF